MLYIIPGFGGDHLMAPRFANDRRMSAGQDFIRVLLDPDCGTGHHVFADSATNGPRGAALVEELIPYLEKTFPIVAEPRARLLTGPPSLRRRRVTPVPRDESARTGEERS